MHSPGRWNPSRRLRSRTWAAAVAGALALSVAGYAAPAGASPGASHQPQVPGAVSPTPASGTPALINNTGNTKDQIRQIVQCGDTMYAVGSFSQVTQGGSTIPRNNVFSFSAIAPYTVTSWTPAANGEVDSIAFNGGDCTHAYIGGDFTSVNGTRANHIAEIDTHGRQPGPRARHQHGRRAGGDAARGQQSPAGGRALHLRSTATPPTLLRQPEPATGKDDGFLHLHISGTYHYCNSGGPSARAHEPTEVYNQQLSHGGTLDLAEGVFTSAGGQARQQIFMLNLATSPASVTGWTSPEWDGSDGNLPDGYPYQCKSACRSTSAPRPGHPATRRSTSPPPAITRGTGTASSR